MPPGTSCEVHDEPVPTNTMGWRTHEAIALGPTGNLQGSVKFYCINTGRVLKRHSFTPMPMPDQVIKRVNAIRQREGQGRAFRFVNRRREPYKWTDEVAETLGDPYAKKSPLPHVPSSLPVAPSIPSHRILGHSRVLNRIALPQHSSRRAPLE